MARVGLADVGDITYNGYPFEGAIKVSASERIHRDDAGRTNVKKTTTIRVEGYIAAGVGDNSAVTDLEMQNLKARLEQSGRRLIFKNKGFGTPIDSNTQPDIDFGPFPTVLEWEPAGGNLTVKIIWTCEYTRPICDTSKSQSAVQFVAFNYEVDCEINEKGYLTRSISGYLEIVNRRTLSLIASSPDNVRKALRAPPMPGFRRRQRYTVDYPKKRLAFSLTDQSTESPNPYPAHVVEIKGTHKFDWNLDNAGMANNSLNFKVECRPDKHTTFAYAIARAIIEQRYELQRRMAGADGSVIIKSISAEEDYFSRAIDLSIAWTQTHDLTQLVERSGLWTPINNVDWESWTRSMEELPYSHYGNELWRLNSNDDIIVDLCHSQQPPTINNKVQLYNAAGNKLGIRNTPPPAERSYLEYMMGTSVDWLRPVASHQTLQSPDKTSGEHPNNMLRGAASLFPTIPGAVDIVIQQSGISKFIIKLFGKAKRAGHPVPKPAVTTVNGQQAVEVGGGFHQRHSHTWLGVPIFEAAWKIAYFIPGAPGAVLPFINVREPIQ